ncbi:MAG: alginate export family protein [Xanthobacteraceae bacterium]|nr:alginate export family protein [Xanthobacteraceae bacterium]
MSGEPTGSAPGRDQGCSQCAPQVRWGSVGASIHGVRVDAFVVRPVLQRDGVFDDTSDTSRAFWGLYTATPLSFVPGGKLDSYYFGFTNTRARFAAGTGEERRETIGARFFGARAGWDWDWEALGQSARLPLRTSEPGASPPTRDTHSTSAIGKSGLA